MTYDEDAEVARPATDWSMARLVELVDAAIDSLGAQLARSEGLRFDWTDASAVLLPRAKSRPISQSQVEDPEPDMAQGIDMV